MPNMKSMINKQNTSRLNKSDNKVDAKQCNCRSDKNCPLNGKCCRNSVVYKAFLKTDETEKFYYGSCETSFKLRYNNYNQSFKGPLPLRAWKRAFFVCFIDIFLRSLQF